jgi:hypothetical protein
VIVRDSSTNWQLPQFIAITGGSIGWQVGIQATDLVLVFKTKRSVKGLLTGKFTIGADAAVAAGPLGREASAATDTALQAEIYSYSRSRGIFGGVTLDGSVLQIDRNATENYYRSTAAVSPGQPVLLPASSLRLIEELNKHVTPRTNISVDQPLTSEQPATATRSDLAASRQRLAAASQRLGMLVDEQWRGYLALPAEVYGGDLPPSAAALEQALRRFQTVAANPNYAALTSQAEFRETLALLEQLLKSTPRPAIVLPPPPMQP